MEGRILIGGISVTFGTRIRPHFGRVQYRDIGTDSGSSGSSGLFKAFQQVKFERGMMCRRGWRQFRPWLEVVCDHTSNYERDTKNRLYIATQAESQVSRFYRGEKITMEAECRIIRGSL